MDDKQSLQEQPMSEDDALIDEPIPLKPNYESPEMVMADKTQWETLQAQLTAQEAKNKVLREALSIASANMYAIENHLAEHPTEIDAGYLAKIFQISHTKIKQALQPAAKEKDTK